MEEAIAVAEVMTLVDIVIMGCIRVLSIKVNRAVRILHPIMDIVVVVLTHRLTLIDLILLVVHIIA